MILTSVAAKEVLLEGLLTRLNGGCSFTLFAGMGVESEVETMTSTEVATFDVPADSFTLGSQGEIIMTATPATYSTASSIHDFGMSFSGFVIVSDAEDTRLLALGVGSISEGGAVEVMPTEVSPGAELTIVGLMIWMEA